MVNTAEDFFTSVWLPNFKSKVIVKSVPASTFTEEFIKEQPLLSLSD